MIKKTSNILDNKNLLNLDFFIKYRKNLTKTVFLQIIFYKNPKHQNFIALKTRDFWLTILTTARQSPRFLAKSAKSLFVGLNTDFNLVGDDYEKTFRRRDGGSILA